MSALTPLETKLLEALEAASEHLDYCGYGDAWERECAKESKLEQQIAEAIKAAREAGTTVPLSSLQVSYEDDMREPDKRIKGDEV